MDDSNVFQLINIFTTVLLVPLVSSLWTIQGRLSKIEGRLETIIREVRE